MDALTQQIGHRNVTDANDHELAEALNDALNLIEMDRQYNGYSDHRNTTVEGRLLALEAALLSLATVVSRRLGL